MKILLVDDTKKHREAGLEQLTANGYEITICSSYSEAVQRIGKGERFDAALLDLLMPAEEDGEHLGEEAAVGYALALKMAISGIKLVAVATDANHHTHPAGAMMDWFIGKDVRIDGSRVLLMHAPMTVAAKDWLKILERLLSDSWADITPPDDQHELLKKIERLHGENTDLRIENTVYKERLERVKKLVENLDASLSDIDAGISEIIGFNELE